MQLGRIIARTVIGSAFAAHGAQKLFGLFGGPGLYDSTRVMEKIGLRPAKRNAVLVSGTEIGGGIALTLGALTPVAAAALIGTTITTIRKVHLPNGPFNPGGYEFPAVLIAGLLAIVDGGPGAPSVDAFYGHENTGSVAAVAALVAGAAVSTVLIELGNDHSR